MREADGFTGLHYSRDRVVSRFEFSGRGPVWVTTPAGEIIKDIELAIASDPTFPDARVFHANLLRSLGRNKEAHAEYVKAKEIDTAGAFTPLIETPMAETKDAPDTAGECAGAATTTT